MIKKCFYGGCCLVLVLGQAVAQNAKTANDRTGNGTEPLIQAQFRTYGRGSCYAWAHRWAHDPITFDIVPRLSAPIEYLGPPTAILLDEKGKQRATVQFPPGGGSFILYCTGIIVGDGETQITKATLIPNDKPRVPKAARVYNYLPEELGCEIDGRLIKLPSMTDLDIPVPTGDNSFQFRIARKLQNGNTKFVYARRFTRPKADVMLHLMLYPQGTMQANGEGGIGVTYFYDTPPPPKEEGKGDAAVSQRAPAAGS